MIDAHITDIRGIYLRTEKVDPMGPQPPGAVYAALPEAEEGKTRMWARGEWVQVPEAELPEQPGPVETSPAYAAPYEVPRYCGLLALKRHRVADGHLQVLGETEDWQEGNSLHAQVLAYRAAMPAGAARDRLDVALNDVLNWTRTSPTVADLCAVLQLSDAQRDALFVWAKAHEATL